jgi:hypothetical protein
MISDYLVAEDVTVLHLMDAAAPRAHKLRSEARVCGERLIYDCNTQPDLGLS